jgi:hypothetical protein
MSTHQRRYTAILHLVERLEQGKRPMEIIFVTEDHEPGAITQSAPIDGRRNVIVSARFMRRGRQETGLLRDSAQKKRPQRDSERA